MMFRHWIAPKSHQPSPWAKMSALSTAGAGRVSRRQAAPCSSACHVSEKGQEKHLEWLRSSIHYQTLLMQGREEATYPNPSTHSHLPSETLQSPSLPTLTSRRFPAVASIVGSVHDL